MKEVKDILLMVPEGVQLLIAKHKKSSPLLPDQRVNSDDVAMSSEKAD